MPAPFIEEFTGDRLFFMPKKKPPTPQVIDFLWVIYDPETGLYFKAVTNNRSGSWIKNPYAYSSEKKLMTGLAYLKHDKRNGASVVIPFNVDLTSAIPAKVYGE